MTIGYKYVEEQWAESTARGEVMLGTMAYFRSFEGRLADRSEGRFSRIINRIDGGKDGLTEREANAIDPLFRVQAGSFHSFEDLIYEEFADEAYILCLSTTADNRHLIAMGKTAI